MIGYFQSENGQWEDAIWEICKSWKARQAGARLMKQEKHGFHIQTLLDHQIDTYVHTDIHTDMNIPVHQTSLL